MYFSYNEVNCISESISEICLIATLTKTIYWISRRVFYRIHSLVLPLAIKQMVDRLAGALSHSAIRRRNTGSTPKALAPYCADVLPMFLLSLWWRTAWSNAAGKPKHISHCFRDIYLLQCVTGHVTRGAGRRWKNRRNKNILPCFWKNRCFS